MAIKMEELLKLSKSTELVIQQVDDDSSEGTVVKILQLIGDVVAVGSIPLPGTGEIARLKSKSVYVASDNIDEFMKDCEYDEVDGVIKYKGPMHLDVSKPGGRLNARTGEFMVTKPAKIWLTKVKFSRAGGALQQTATEARTNFITKFFGGNKIAEVGAEDTTSNKGAGEKVDEKKAPEPVAVENGKKEKVK